MRLCNAAYTIVHYQTYVNDEEAASTLVADRS